LVIIILATPLVVDGGAIRIPLMTDDVKFSAHSVAAATTLRLYPERSSSAIDPQFVASITFRHSCNKRFYYV